MHAKTTLILLVSLGLVACSHPRRPDGGGGRRGGSPPAGDSGIPDFGDDEMVPGGNGTSSPDTGPGGSVDTGPIVVPGGGGELPCEGPDGELWRVPVTESGTLRVEVDTVSALDTFDPAVEILEVLEWSATPTEILFDGQLAYGDDEFDCSYPPPSYRCPSAEAQVYEEDVAVLVKLLGQCTGSVGAYQLHVDLDGFPLTATPLGVVYSDNLAR